MASFQTRSISDIGTAVSLSISKIWWAMSLVILFSPWFVYMAIIPKILGEVN